MGTQHSEVNVNKSNCSNVTLTVEKFLRQNVFMLCPIFRPAQSYDRSAPSSDQTLVGRWGAGLKMGQVRRWGRWLEDEVRLKDGASNSEYLFQKSFSEI